MGANRVERLTPNWIKTVGAMIGEKVLVQAWCRRCGICLRVDLEAIAAVKGRGFSLIGKHPRCKRVDCDGEILFQYSPAEGTPFRPMPER